MVDAWNRFSTGAPAPLVAAGRRSHSGRMVSGTEQRQARAYRRGVGAALALLLTLFGVVVGAAGAVARAADPDGPAAGRSPGLAASTTGSSPSPVVLSRHPRAGWTWPVGAGGGGPPSVVRGFDPPAQRWGTGHRGVDVGAAVGTVVVAPSAGVVTFAGTVVDRGVVVVTHPGGLRSTFEPVDATVTVGAVVAAGQPIGTLSATPGHCAPASCLHWGVLRGETYLDPLAVLGLLRVVLLPLA